MYKQGSLSGGVFAKPTTNSLLPVQSDSQDTGYLNLQWLYLIIFFNSGAALSKRNII